MINSKAVAIDSEVIVAHLCCANRVSGAELDNVGLNPRNVEILFCCQP